MLADIFILNSQLLYIYNNYLKTFGPCVNNRYTKYNKPPVNAPLPQIIFVGYKRTKDMYTQNTAFIIDFMK